MIAGVLHHHAAALRKADSAERKLRVCALRAERDEYFKLARQRKLSDESSRKLVREVDLIESRCR